MVLAWLQGKPADPARWHLDLRIFLLYVAVHPLLEEIAFRGLIQETLLRRLPYRFGPLSAANLITSLLFAATHFGTRESWLAAAIFVPSLVFGYFRERHDSLASPIVLHAFYNAAALLLVG